MKTIVPTLCQLLLASLSLAAPGTPIGALGPLVDAMSKNPDQPTLAYAPANVGKDVGLPSDLTIALYSTPDCSGKSTTPAQVLKTIPRPTYGETLIDMGPETGPGNTIGSIGISRALEGNEQLDLSTYGQVPWDHNTVYNCFDYLTSFRKDSGQANNQCFKLDSKFAATSCMRLVKLS